MKPEISADDSGEELGLPIPVDDDNDILDVSPHISVNEQRETASKVDNNFFNRFDDDFDESDMKPAS